MSASFGAYRDLESPGTGRPVKKTLIPGQGMFQSSDLLD